MRLNHSKLQIHMANECFSIGDLAKKAGLSRSAITKYMNNRANPKPVTIGKLARALNVSVMEIIESTTAIVDNHSK